MSEIKFFTRILRYFLTKSSNYKRFSKHFKRYLEQVYKLKFCQFQGNDMAQHVHHIDGNAGSDVAVKADCTEIRPSPELIAANLEMKS